MSDSQKTMDPASKLKNATPQDLQLAYQLVEADLLSSLTKSPEATSVRLGQLGKFTKSLTKRKCNLDGKDYVFYTIKFSGFTKLKRILDQQIISRYA
jgi:hypothetical protein